MSFYRRALAILATLALAVVFAMVAATAQAACTTPCAYDQYVTGTANSGLVAYYPMYETSGTTMNDTSGNGKNGTYSNSVVLNGTAGAAFDGSFAIASTPALNLTSGNVVTVAFWAKDQETRSNEHLIFENTTNMNNNIGAFYFSHYDHTNALTGTQHYKLAQRQGTGTHYNLVDFATTASSLWHFYVVEMDRDTNRGCYSGFFIYDGTTQTQGADQCWEMNGVAFLNQAMYFGARSGNQFPWTGTLRGLGIWTRSLTGTEISDLVAAQYG